MRTAAVIRHNITKKVAVLPNNTICNLNPGERTSERQPAGGSQTSRANARLDPRHIVWRELPRHFAFFFFLAHRWGGLNGSAYESTFDTFSTGRSPATHQDPAVFERRQASAAFSADACGDVPTAARNEVHTSTAAIQRGQVTTTKKTITTSNTRNNAGCRSRDAMNKIVSDLRTAVQCKELNPTRKAWLLFALQHY